MAYFTFVSLEEYGADDGLVIAAQRVSAMVEHAGGCRIVLLDSGDIAGRDIQLPHAALALRAGHCRCPHNEQRMQALGFSTFRYKLTCYVISAMIVASLVSCSAISPFYQP